MVGHTARPPASPSRLPAPQFQTDPRTHVLMQADRDPREDEEAVPSDDEGLDPSSIRREGSDEEGEDLMDNMEA